LEQYARLTQRLGHIPVEWRIVARVEDRRPVPHAEMFRKRFGSKSKLLEAVKAFCRKNAGFSNVATMCESAIDAKSDHTRSDATKVRAATGFVYLIESVDTTRSAARIPSHGAAMNLASKYQYRPGRSITLRLMIPLGFKRIGTKGSTRSVERANGSVWTLTTLRPSSVGRRSFDRSGRLAEALADAGMQQPASAVNSISAGTEPVCGNSDSHVHRGWSSASRSAFSCVLPGFRRDF
jgi:hypothetical protein